GICGEFLAWRNRRMNRRMSAAVGNQPPVRHSGSSGAALVMRDARPMSAGEPVLRADNIAKHYGGLKAVKGVSISIEEGELRGLIGPNGAGKSTFFRMLAGEIQPTFGRVYLRNQDITGIGVTQVCQLGM